MTDEQVLAAQEIREIAKKNNLVVSAIWCAKDVLDHYNNNRDDEDLTYDEAEELLLNWQKQLEENGVENGWRVIDMMLDFSELDDEED